jgi:hypothetical protein
MSMVDFADTAAGVPDPELAYTPGVCNIGPAEIARRRQAGHVGVIAAAGLFVGLLVAGAPRPARLLVALPAAIAASGYLQARMRFCAGFGSRGVFNFGEVGRTTEVVDEEARARDRARSMQIGLASLAIGIGAGVAAAAIPSG